VDNHIEEREKRVVADINFGQVGAIFGAIGQIFQQLPGGQTAPTYSPNVPTYGQNMPTYSQPTARPDTIQWGGGGAEASQVQSVYQQLLRRNPSAFELQQGSEAIRYEGYQAFVEGVRRKAGLPSGSAAPAYQQPQPVYQQPQPVYQPPQPVYQQPQPVYQPPQPVYQPPQPVYQPQPPVYYQQPGAPAPGGGTPLPMGPLPAIR